MRAPTGRLRNRKLVMSLYHLLQQRAAAGRPVRVGLIGAGKFGSMFLNQVPTMPGLEVSVNVEADVLAGPSLAEEARGRGVVYSLAYGDQPALTCELVDWARACGFEVVAAGKGTKYLPAYHAVTPADVWHHYGLTPDEARRGGMNPQMFNSFLDG